jgi:hypothetical protein
MKKAIEVGMQVIAVEIVGIIRVSRKPPPQVVF